MAKLTAAKRKGLAGSDFALPGRRFPIQDKNHAHAALSMAHNASPAEQAVIRRKVKARYPSMQVRSPKGTYDKSPGGRIMSMGG
jgi:hypothetical protein